MKYSECHLIFVLDRDVQFYLQKASVAAGFQPQVESGVVSVRLGWKSAATPGLCG